MHEDLDARLVDVVATAMLVIDAHRRFEIGEQVRGRDTFADELPDDRRAALASTNPDVIDIRARRILADDDADVVHLDRGAILWRRRHGNLELAREVREFRMERRPLADDLGPDARILDFVSRGTGEMIRCHVANAVAAGLDRMHLDRGELTQDLRHVGKTRPVILQVLARREMAIALVELARDVGELVQLARRQRAIGNGHAQHVGVELQVDAVHEPQRLELVFGHLARKAACHLAGELQDALVHRALVKFVVAIHQEAACLPRSRRTVGPAARMISRCLTGLSDPLSCLTSKR